MTTPYYCAFHTEYWDWVPFMALAILISFFIVAIVYMLSQFTRRVDWEFWAKSELYQTIIACILIGGIVVFASLSCNISWSIAGGDPFNVADKYLQHLLWDEMMPQVQMMFDKSLAATKVAAFSIAVPSCTGLFCFAPFAGYSTVSYMLETLAFLVTPIGASLLFQKLFLSFVKETAFVFLLPIGFILKTIPFTREAGAYLMAIAVGFFIVFPLTYLFDKVVMDEVKTDPLLSAWCNNDRSGLGWSTALIGHGKMCSLYETTGALIPQAVFLPALNFIITVTFIRVLVKVFTHDYQLVELE